MENEPSRLNYLKLNSKWREILKQEKQKRLMSEADILFASHQHLLDLKNNVLERMAVDAAQAEEQYSVALKSHIEHLQSLIELQNNRLNNQLGTFVSDRMNLESEFSYERAVIQAKHCQDKADALGILQRLEKDFMDSEADFKNDWNSLREDVKNKHLEEKHALRIQLDGTIEDLWRQFQNALDQYTLNTEDRKKHFEELKTKDLKNASEIDIQMKKLVQIQESIAYLKSKLNHNVQQHAQRIQTLTTQKQTLSKAFLNLKRHLYKVRSLHEDQLTKMVVSSSGALESLEQKKQIAENIISLAQLNSKLVDKDDVIINQLTLFLRENVGLEEEKELAKELENAEIPENIKNVENFYIQYNKASLDNLKLKHTLTKLKQKNDLYRQQMRLYMKGFTVDSETLDGANSLMMVNGNNGGYKPEPLGNKNLPIQDANLIVQSYQKSAIQF